MTQPLSILFTGPSGAGKGTQVQMLIDALNKRDARGVVYIEMGALLREQVAAGGYTAGLTNDIVSNGKLMPAFMPIYLMTRRLVEQFTGEQHIIADAVVRRIPQAEAFDDAMRFYDRPNYHVVAMELSEESIVKRLMARGRNDDNEEKIRRRIAWYKEEVLPALAILESRGATVHHIDGEPDVETIHADILGKLGLT
jgi:adenylate kinase